MRSCPDPAANSAAIRAGSLEVRDVVHPHLDAVLVAPLLGELVEPDVVGRHEVAPQ